MIGKNEAVRKAGGESPGFYFVDLFSLNQVAIDGQSANMHQVVVGQLVRDLRDTLLGVNSPSMKTHRATQGLGWCIETRVWIPAFVLWRRR